MAGDSVSVTYAALENAAAGFQSSMGKLTNTVGDLNQQIGTKLMPIFHGTTAANFSNNLGLVNRGFQEMEQVLAQLSKVLTEANTTYQAADKSAASLFQ